MSTTPTPTPSETAPAVENTPPITEPTPEPSKAEPKKRLTPSEIVRAMTNDPNLSEIQFELGNRKFTVVDLSYRNYLLFLTYIQPLLEFLQKRAGGNTPALPDIEMGSPKITANEIMVYLKENLPKLVALVCNQAAKSETDKVDENWIQDNAKTPFQLAQIVWLQVQQNQMIQEFTDFFGQIFPAMKK